MAKTDGRSILVGKVAERIMTEGNLDIRKIASELLKLYDRIEELERHS